ncbi:CoA transferase [Pseudonocardia xishanensis]|uniref:CaiB/BaiF CoA-transferase family protein n=1 Tax=Pseudonocardia xishanensis TaxID=630995 RepID=A0ABP8RV14_9PSEU
MGPLAGVTVIDLTRALSGPYATLLLAGLGATVIKIEEPGAGDVARGNVPYAGRGGLSRVPVEPDDMSVPFLERGRGKLGVTLNLKHAGAREVLADLIRGADVLVENFSAGTADRLGVGYSWAHSVNPRLVYTSISGSGATEVGDTKAYDLITQALSGLTMTTGSSGEPPVRAGLPFGDAIAPLFAVIGTVSALFAAQESGEGQHVDVSMLGALTSMVAIEPWQAYDAVGMSARTGSFLNRLAPFGLFPAKDGEVAVCAANDRFFARLPAAIGRPELLEDDRFARRAHRAANADAIHAIVAEWTRVRTVEEVVRLLSAADVPAAPVRTPVEAVTDARVRARGETVALSHPVYGPVGDVVASGLPIVFSRDTAEIDGDAPLLGQDNDRVYGTVLGYERERLDAMAADGLI